MDQKQYCIFIAPGLDIMIKLPENGLQEYMGQVSKAIKEINPSSTFCIV